MEEQRQILIDALEDLYAFHSSQIIELPEIEQEGYRHIFKHVNRPVIYAIKNNIESSDYPEWLIDMKTYVELGGGHRSVVEIIDSILEIIK
jgi:hypothetical protein